MAYIIKPSTFGVGYSIFRLEVKDGKRVEIYLADATSISEAKALCPNATSVFCPSLERTEIAKYSAVS